MDISQKVRADTDGQSIWVECDSFSNRDYVALVPGAKWRANDGLWQLNLTWASCKALRSLFGENLELGDALIQWGINENQSRIVPCMSLRDVLNPGKPYPMEFDDRLYPYQVAGSMFLTAAKKAILSDPVGAGKSATSISAAKYLNSLPMLVVAPKSTLIGWQREVERWWPGIPCYVIDGDKKKRQTKILEVLDAPGIVIINWESLRLHSRLSPYGSTRLSEEERTPKELNHVEWKIVVADEGHRAANPTSKQTRALWFIGHSPSVEYRWILTGTPMTDQIDTLFSPLHFIEPNEWPSKVAFIDRYAQTRVVPWGSGIEIIGLNRDNEEEFQEIFQPRFRRMPKEIILPQLPPIQRTRRYLEMSAVQRRCYEEMAEEMVTETESGELLIAANPAVKMMRLVQFSSATVDMVNMHHSEENEDHDPEDNLVARLVDPSNKLDALEDDLSDLIAAGESIIVFAVSRQLIEMAEKRLQKAKIPFSVIKGNQNSSFRQQQIDDFQNKKVPVILVVISAGGTGVNLTRGRIAIFLQRSWDFVSNHQAEGRLHRIGSEKYAAIEIIDYISQNTVDEAVVQVAEGKEFALEQIVRDRDAVRRLLQGMV